MTRTVHFIAAGLGAVLFCSVAGAQMRGGASPMRISSLRIAPAARAVPPASRAIRTMRPIQILPSGRIGSSFSQNAYSTTNGRTAGGRRNGRPTNFGRGGFRDRGVFVPLVVNGYPYPSYFCDTLDDWYGDSCQYDSSQPQEEVQQEVQEQPQQQPQVIVLQQPVPVARPPLDSGAYAAPYAAPPDPAPAHDVGEFVLVRRDGRILFASAFSVTGTQLTYVTLEGIRRTVPLSDLDADATQQMNEARGTSVQLHN